ncbi:MAG: hypothetical protein AAFY34_10945 [Pseudomonadota bacterium]
MRKYRHGGYAALSPQIRERIGDLTGYWGREEDEANILKHGWLVNLAGLAILFACIFAAYGIGVWLPHFVRDNVHLAGRPYKFAELEIGFGSILGIFAGIFVSGAITTSIFSRFGTLAEIAAESIVMTLRNQGQHSASARDFQNYLLDRTPDQIGADAFLEAYVKQSEIIYWRWTTPLLVLTAVLFFLDTNNYRRLALEGYRTSGYFQLGSTLHPLSSLERIEVGCRPLQLENGTVRARPHYTLFFPDTVTLDLYDRDLKSNYGRLKTIEAYDKLLGGWGASIIQKHRDEPELTDGLDMNALCHEAVERIYKTHAEPRARAILRLGDPPSETMHNFAGG